MSSSRVDKNGVGITLLSASGKWVAHVHTALAYTAFVGCLLTAMALHYKKIVKNEFYGYPEEWFPSVSATIGDWFPERNLFQVLIAVASGPRFALIGLWYLLTSHRNTKLPAIVACVGLLRTITCGGWVYVTSSDNHDWHDIFMISYLLLTIPWNFGVMAVSPVNPRAMKLRKRMAACFYGVIVPLVYFFIQHKVHRVPGAYTIYAFLEWSLILFDVGFDSITALDFDTFELRVVDVAGKSAGKPETKGARSAEVEKAKKEKGYVYAQTTAFSKNEALDFVADCYHGFVFWTTLTSLGVCVWYFPLWNMGISGYEAMLVTTLAPVFLGIGPLRRIIAANPGVFHLLSLIGIVSYRIEDPAHRLMCVGAGVALTTSTWCAIFQSLRGKDGEMERMSTAWGIGLVMSNVVKYACFSNNPLWPIMNDKTGGWNKTGIALAILACVRTIVRQRRVGEQTPVLEGNKKQEKMGSVFFAACGLAGLLFALQSLLSDSTTMILWVWDGFPVRGPLAVPHGAVTMIAMSVGIILSTFSNGFGRNWVFYTIACISTFFLHKIPGWFGYYGALILTVYLMSLIPEFFRSAATVNKPGRVFGLAWLFYCLFVLAHVWVVAYEFVPGGPLLRERTDLVLTFMMGFIGLGVYNATSLHGHGRSKQAQAKLQPMKASTRSAAYGKSVLSILCAAAIAIAYLRFPTYDFKPYHPEEKLFTAGIWTIHFGLDNDMWASEIRMRDAIRDLELDVIGLLESDNQRIIMGNRDLTQRVAEELGMYADYGPGPNKHTWGAALLSKFPILNSTHHLLPSPRGELAPAIHATLDVYGTRVDIIVSHNGQEENPEDRFQQTTELARIMREDSDRPLVFLGYVVTKPHEGNYPILIDDAHMHDIEPEDWDRWCEYVAFRGVKRVGYARVSRGTITDTEIQTGKFVVVDADVDEGMEVVPSYRRVGEGEVPEGYRYPGMFRGEGVRGHRYHVFDEPWYYD
ncbi:Protein cwh43 [Saitoella coloradoensis]